MAAPLTIQDIGNQVAQYVAELQSKGLDITKKHEVVAAMKKLLASLDQIQPHINTAQNAFGGQESLQQQANDLRNRLNKIIAAYS